MKNTKKWSKRKIKNKKKENEILKTHLEIKLHQNLDGFKIHYRKFSKPLSKVLILILFQTEVRIYYTSSNFPFIPPIRELITLIIMVMMKFKITERLINSRKVFSRLNEDYIYNIKCHFHQKCSHRYHLHNKLDIHKLSKLGNIHSRMNDHMK